MNKQMTTQDVFNTVYLHLRQQKVQAMQQTTNMCQYLTKEGLKCAVGCLIPESYYDSSFEKLGVSLVRDDRPYYLSLDFYNGKNHVEVNKEVLSFMKKHRPLLLELQELHDEGEFHNPTLMVESFNLKMKYIAEMFDLNTKVMYD